MQSISDVSYSISVIGTQLIFNGTTFNQIRGTFFQRDSAYFAFRNILDQLHRDRENAVLPDRGQSRAYQSAGTIRAFAGELS